MQTRTKNTGRIRTRKTRKNKKVTLRVRRKRQQLKKTLKGGLFFGKKPSNYRTIIDVFYLPQRAQNDKLPCYTGKLVLNVYPSDPDKDSLIDYARANEDKNQKPIEVFGKVNIMSYLVNNYMGVHQKTNYNGKTQNQVDYKKDIIPDVEFYTKILKTDGIIGDDNRNKLTKNCLTIDNINNSGVTGVRTPEHVSLPPSSPLPSPVSP